jgi:hypothetical protein
VSAVALLVLASAQSAVAVPIPIGPPVVGPGNGLNTHWVAVDAANKPDTIAEAIDTLAKGPLDPGFVAAVDQVNVPVINHEDGCFGGGCGDFFGGDLASPLGASDHFAVRFDGYLNIVTGGTYSFQTRHDDGFRLMIGGDVVSIFATNTAPATTTNSVDLVAGFYAFEFIGWEQGGEWVHELSWDTPGIGGYTLPGSSGEEVFFTSNPVPEPGTLSLIGLGLAGLAARRRSRRG